MVEHRLDRVLGAVADPTRRAILDRLRRSSATVGTLAAPLPMSFAAVSKHVRVLEAAGLVQREVRGREHWLHVDARPLREVDAWVERYREFWEQRLDQLEVHLTRKRNRRSSKKERST